MVEPIAGVMGARGFHESSAFVHLAYRNPHPARARALLSAHPEIRELMRPAPVSFVVILALGALQLTTAWLVRSAGAGWIVLAAASVGAIVTVGLYGMLHEASHGSIFGSRAANRFAAHVANLPLVWPAAESFLKHHVGHHSHLASYARDVSVPRAWEAELFGSSALGKAVWLALYPLIYPLRVFRMVSSRPACGDRAWFALNAVIQIVVTAALTSWLGPRALAYLVLSYFFAFGLHPLNAITIQEHSFAAFGQDSHSYYGLGNWLTFNAGYHTEHHDLPAIPWCRLPALARIAPEFYRPLVAYRSWTLLLLCFVFDRNWSLWRRGVRVGQPLSIAAQRRGLTIPSEAKRCVLAASGPEASSSP